MQEPSMVSIAWQKRNSRDQRHLWHTMLGRGICFQCGLKEY